MSTATSPVFFFVWGSRKSPSWAKLTTEATAPPNFIDDGRIMATGPNFLSRKSVGSGMIKLACRVSRLRNSGFVSPCAALRIEKVTDDLNPESLNGDTLQA